jgi:hypothetical protein
MTALDVSAILDSVAYLLVFNSLLIGAIAFLAGYVIADARNLHEQYEWGGR